MTRRPKPMMHGRDHAPDGPDPIPDLGGGCQSFGGWHGSFSHAALGTTPAYLPVSDFSTTSDSVFDEDTGFVQILTAGMYQIAAYAEIRYDSTPTDDERAWLWVWFYDDGAGSVGFSLESPNAGLAQNDQDFPALVNRFRWLQRIIPISLTDAADFPITVKPEITLSDDSNLRVNNCSVWGYRMGDPLDASLSD